jgi:hypothetical protein
MKWTRPYAWCIREPSIRGVRYIRAEIIANVLHA